MADRSRPPKARGSKHARERIGIATVMALLAALLLVTSQPAGADDFPNRPTCPANAEGSGNIGDWGYIRATQTSCIFRNSNTPNPNPVDNTTGSIPEPDNNDFVLVFSGQSNSIANRNYSSQSDGLAGRSFGNGNVYVWVPSINDWANPNLCTQSWDGGNWPGNPSASNNVAGARNPGCGTHPGYHMAASIAARGSGQDVYLIATGEDGAALEKFIGRPEQELRNCLGRTVRSWDWKDGDETQISRIKTRINDALNNNVRVDAFGWVHGEANADSDNWVRSVNGDTPRQDGQRKYECKLGIFIDWLDDASRHGDVNDHIDFGGATTFIAAHIRAQDDGYRNINKALDQMPNVRAFTKSANYPSISQAGQSVSSTDFTHFSNEAIENMGKGMAACLFSSASC